MLIKINKKDFKAEVRLPESKSISNRALMICAYGGFDFSSIDALSEADDTRMLIENLQLIQQAVTHDLPTIIHCGNAGTVFRFLVSYLASFQGNWILTGDERMKSRPVSDLVNGLKQLGANIQYVEKEGFAPLHIQGKQLQGGKTMVSMEKSSQFASSLVLAAPTWKNGLELELSGNLSSMPYLEMSLNVMKWFGAHVVVSNRIIHILPLEYKKKHLTVEPDWSAAAFWFELVALSEGGELLIKDLSSNSLQGDKEMVSMFSQLGVEAFEEPDGLLIFKTGKIAKKLQFDLHDHPDMLPALAATCAGLKVQARFTGLENLKYKESDRTAALQTELLKIGCRFDKITEGVFDLHPKTQITDLQSVYFQTYHDHRMAMALSPLAMVIGAVTIENPSVVVKSYPHFFKELNHTQAVTLIEPL